MSGESVRQYGMGTELPVVGRGAVRRSAARRGGQAGTHEQPLSADESIFDQLLRGIDWARIDPMVPTDCLRRPVDDRSYNGG